MVILRQTIRVGSPKGRGIACPFFRTHGLRQSQLKRCRQINQRKFNGIKTAASQNGSGRDEDNNKGGGHSNGDGDGPSELNTLLRLIVAYPATRGTIAVALGYLINCDPLETLKWSPDAVTTGLLFAIPVIMCDAFTMLPDWEPKRISKKIKLLVPRVVVERLNAGKETKQIADIKDSTSTSTSSSSSNGSSNSNAISGEAKRTTELREDDQNDSNSATNSQESVNSIPEGMVEIEREVSVSGDVPPLQQALYTLQMNSVLNNRGRALSPWSELFLLILVHVSEEMLYRGLLLSVVIRWLTENLYYAGVEENVEFFGGLTLALPQVGAVTGATGVSLAAVALLLRRYLNPLLVLNQAAEKFNKDGENEQLSSKRKSSASEQPNSINGNPPDNSEVLAALEKARLGILQQHRWTIALEASNELLHWATASASFLLAGNIIAPISGSIASDIFYSYCQRVKLEKLQADIEARHQASVARAEETQELLKAVKEHLKEKLAERKNEDS